MLFVDSFGGAEASWEVWAPKLSAYHPWWKDRCPLFALYQAILEVISSEHSYLASLHTLIRMFKNSPELGRTMTSTERHHLFSNISDVCEASEK